MIIEAPTNNFFLIWDGTDPKELAEIEPFRSAGIVEILEKIDEDDYTQYELYQYILEQTPGNFSIHKFSKYDDLKYIIAQYPDTVENTKTITCGCTSCHSK
jgi:hypothetical protein